MPSGVLHPGVVTSSSLSARGLTFWDLPSRCLTSRGLTTWGLTSSGLTTMGQFKKKKEKVQGSQLQGCYDQGLTSSGLMTRGLPSRVLTAIDLTSRPQLFEGRLALNPGFSSFCSKAFSRIIFSFIFRASNHQPVDKKN